MESLFLDRIQEFGDFINWPYLFLVMMIAWLVNDVVMATPKNPKFLKVGRAYLKTKQVRAITVGLLLFIVFFLLEGVYTGHEVLRYLASLFFAMFIMWDGLQKWWKKIKSKFPNSENHGEQGNGE